jgi:hypothetical protein
MPHIPDDEELEERDNMRWSILADVFIEDEEERGKFKDALWMDSLEEYAKERQASIESQPDQKDKQ